MSTILTTPTTPSLDHFRNPWIAPAWVFLVALAVAVITVLTAWGLRLVRNRYRAPKVVVVEKKKGPSLIILFYRVPAIPPPPEGATPEVIEANRMAHTGKIY